MSVEPPTPALEIAPVAELPEAPVAPVKEKAPRAATIRPVPAQEGALQALFMDRG